MTVVPFRRRISQRRHREGEPELMAVFLELPSVLLRNVLKGNDSIRTGMTWVYEKHMGVSHNTARVDKQ